MPAEKKDHDNKTIDCFVDETKAITTEERDGLTFGRVPFVMSKEIVDSDDEVILIRGIDLSDFIKNGVILWCHRLGGFFQAPQPSDVIGQIDPKTLRKTKTELLGDVLFNITREDKSIANMWGILGGPMEPEAFDIFQRLKARTLKAGSIGFRSIERSEKPVKKGQKGLTHIKTLLKEFSICALGSNSAALAKGAFAKSFESAEESDKLQYFKNLTELMTPQDMELLEDVIDGINCEKILADPDREFIPHEEVIKQLCEITDEEREFIKTHSNIVGSIVEKVGAELSKKNRKAIQNCRDQSKKIHDDLNIVLKEDNDDNKGLTAADAVVPFLNAMEGETESDVDIQKTELPIKKYRVVKPELK